MKHFTIEEMSKSDIAKRLNVDNTPDAKAIEAIKSLVEKVLDPLREAYGKPIKVNSGYRCPTLNKAVGGAKNSQHTLGEAADITGGNQAENQRLFNLIRVMGLPYDQLIDEHKMRWLHVSYSQRHRRQVIHIK